MVSLSNYARETTLVLIGSLVPALRRASLAVASSTPSTSKIIRPGLTSKQYPEGSPFPLPMGTSGGFEVNGLSGKILIHVRPALVKECAVAFRADSIWFDLIRPEVK